MPRLARLWAACAVAAAAALLPATAAADILERLAEDPVIRLGYRTDAPPFSYAGDTGLPRGYSVDLCLRIADRIEAALQLERLDRQWVTVTAADRFDQLENGAIDLLCGATTMTFSRRLSMDFTLSTFITGAALLVPADAQIGDLQELAGTTIGARAGSTTAQSLGGALQSAGIEAEVRTFEDHRDGVAAVEAGELDAYMADRALLLALVGGHPTPDAFAVSTTTYSTEIYAIALPRGESRLRLIADQALSATYRDGIVSIFRSHFGPEAEPGDLLRALYRLNTLPQ